MNRSSVWSFRTQTGVARVVNGRLRVRHTPRGLIRGARSAGWESWLQPLALGGGFIGMIGPLRRVGRAVIAEQSLAAVLSAAGVGALLLAVSMVAVVGSGLWSTLSRSSTVPIYDITAVSVDDTELTVSYEADDGEHETTVAARDDEALDEAVEILHLKGAPVERN